MAALSGNRNTPERMGADRVFPVAATIHIYAGAMVALNTSKFLVPASATATLKVVGRAEKEVNNAEGSAGAKSCPTSAGVFRYGNAAADPVTTADIGSDCYAVDDQTVAKTSGTNTRPVAGKVFDVDADGVWVRFA